jgi:hypothetical protein
LALYATCSININISEIPFKFDVTLNPTVLKLKLNKTQALDCCVKGVYSKGSRHAFSEDQSLNTELLILSIPVIKMLKENGE